MDFPGKPKFGTYAYSSEFLEKFSFFGGVAVNTQFDTDMFGLFEYHKFYPTLFLELYQVRRQTSEEETYLDYDVKFDLLGATFGARWPIDGINSVKTALDYSRYRSQGSGIEKYQKVFFKWASTYHKGTTLQLEWKHKLIPPHLLAAIAPRVGRNFTVRVDHAWQSFYDSTSVNSKYGTPVDEYLDYSYNQYSIDWIEYFPSLFSTHSFMARFKGGYIDKPIDGFYHFYAGGLEGMKGYPFYSMEGRKLIHAELAYRFPLIRNINLNLAMLHFKDAFISVYGDVGNAWISGKLDNSDLKRDVGVQLRVSTFAYYGFPMKIAFDAAYGLDSFTSQETKYGKEWRYYFTLLFDFMD